MANVVLGLGCSHSPMLNMEPEAWIVRGQHDRNNKFLRDAEGNECTYEDLLRAASPSVMKEITMDKIAERHEANQRGIDSVRKALYDAKVDILVMFGDDHMEVFNNEIMPPVAVYWGEKFPYVQYGILKWPYEPNLKPDLWYWDEAREFPVASDLGRHLIESLMHDNFDVSHSKSYRSGIGMSHSYAFVYRRVMTEGVIPTVPIHLNTYFPPNQPTPERCYRLGQAVRRAIESWTGDARVAVLGSGGLSHFVVDEDLDHKFLSALKSNSIESHAALPLKKLNSGNSELRNWSAVAGAMEHLDMQLFDYVPCYRSPAGTGCAMAFAQWI